jgi:hypothetical protein
MPLRLVLSNAMLLGMLWLALPTTLAAQVAAIRFPTWADELPQRHRSHQGFAWVDNSTTRSHTGTGLLVGGLIGAAATTLFLIGFCGDPDTSCGADEVGRASLVIAVPTAAVGALIGTLVRTGR